MTRSGQIVTVLAVLAASASPSAAMDMEPLWLEGMGFCKPGQGGRMIDQGITPMDGKLPVNPSGGVLSAHAVLVAGLARIIEATLQVRGDAGSRQVPGAKTALAHGFNGPCGQSHCVWVLSGEK